MSKAMKWIIAALALSIAVNIFVVGFAIGKRVIGPPSGREAGAPPGGGLNMRSLGRYLSHEERRAARELLAENRNIMRAKGKEIRQNERAIRQILMAETVDVEGLAAHIDRQQMLIRDTQLTMQRALLEFVATLDVETRRKVAKDLFRHPRRSGVAGPPGDRRAPGEAGLPPPGDRHHPGACDADWRDEGDVRPPPDAHF